MLWLALLAWMLGATTPAHAADAEPPAQTLIRTEADAFIARLRTDAATNDADPSHLLRTAEEMVLPHFDFVLISQRALGRHWRAFTDEQKARFVREFRAMLLRTYARTLNEHRDATVGYLPWRELSQGGVRVRTQVTRSDGPPVQIDYEVRQRGDAWKICDVTVNGVSLIISYRAGFQKDIAALGAEGLIAQLEARNQSS